MEVKPPHQDIRYEHLTLYDNKTKDTATKLFIPSDEKPFPSKYLALVNKKEVRKPLIGISDSLLCLLVLAPAVVGFWRGTWMLLDIYGTYFPPLQSFLLGAFIHLVFTLIQDSFYEIVKGKSPNLAVKILNMVTTRFYIYVFALSSNMHWRGQWALMDYYLGVRFGPDGRVLEKGSERLIIGTIGCWISLMVLRSFRNCVAPPFVFCLDRKDTTFVIQNRFKTKMSERTSLYILDCLFSVLVIGTLVVFVWRGAWALIDIFLFPGNETLSAWGSLIVGYSAVAIAFMLQPLMRWLCDRITGFSRLLVADVFLILSLIGTVNVWRGIWNLLNIYLLPDNLEASCWITHWICLIILILLGCSNSLLVRGVYIDAEEPAGKCVVFPCHYLRLIFQEQKLKKLQSEQNKTELTNVKPFENNHIISVQNEPALNHKEGEV
ncbi:uncharacterized protein fusl isoform X1 [Tribolium castaneum]|uniref:uncharacterized protein fusl isoform X1 n=1 Tax=Tribolium castaneum TaxID=7070 RepID=UPI00046C029A|nr:PREDICTED: uncharacterized protein LOC662748 isoform X1 [Tribolium castaneum]XP_015838663.1 PREDICTED: uncharacterized protein LOC662748 isoform X1 [Tribolium castaneum]XP_015838664.1 PREDICTED: uncharacterized protein LOC662748 isoform X1 [Tribolium castaneum]XP_015838665.1 PREDICTED: uncharacterized protein LOC662748 isoform X1 [Tribolium castaneum]|eukprot:XP_008197613.1 PREDICTED: uncharacterized protein LOC662748 isoform X1 [Tribolium castaneum]